MYVKLKHGQPDQFPYGFEQFRKDNPNTSFPDNIPVEMLRRYAVFPVEVLPKPEFDPLSETLVRDELPHREVIRLKTETDATDPLTGEVDNSQVGQPIYGNRWLIGYAVQQLPLDKAARNVRDKRDGLLADTDWIVAVSYERGEPVSERMAIYRQSLRDIPEQEGFPYEVEWPTKPR